MASQAQFQEPHGNRLIQVGMIALALIALLAVIVYLYNAFTGVHGVKVQEDRPVISPLLPPPPPPPPPPKVQEKPPEPTEKPTPTPTPSPAKTPEAPAPMQMNAEAQAGPGSIAAGSGSGSGAPSSSGTCIGDCGNSRGPVGLGDGLYRQYLRSALQTAVMRDSRVNKLSFTADFDIVVTPDGRIEHVRLRRSSGNGRRDNDLKEIIENLGGLRKPPVSSRYPVIITVEGRRPL